jgi:hypothetical protein
VAWNPCSAKCRSAADTISARVLRPLFRWRTGLGAAASGGMAVDLILARK